MRLTFILSLLISTNTFSQKVLDLTYHNIFGKEKTFHFFNNHEFSFRLKGKFFYHTHKLTNMQDSFLVFDNEQIVKLGHIKSIRIKGAKISSWIYTAGFGFLALDVAGNLIQLKNPIVNERTLAITGVIIAAAAVVSYFQDKHVRITKNCTFRIIDHDFQNLNAGK
jgi:hypothetical protein